MVNISYDQLNQILLDINNAIVKAEINYRTIKSLFVTNDEAFEKASKALDLARAVENSVKLEVNKAQKECNIAGGNLQMLDLAKKTLESASATLLLARTSSDKANKTLVDIISTSNTIKCSYEISSQIVNDLNNIARKVNDVITLLYK